MNSSIAATPSSVSGGVSRRGLILILAGTAAFMVVVAVAVFWLLGKEEKTARHGSARFASALVHNDPAAAPAGGADYVRGVRAHFGPVSSARVIGAHNRSINTGDSADTRSFFVTEMLLQTRRGPAAIELEFDNHSLSSDEISSVHELEPAAAPGLSKAERHRLATAFAARGGMAASASALGVAAPATVGTSPAPTPVGTPGSSPAERQLRCVQDAHGDVAKIQRCAGA